MQVVFSKNFTKKYTRLNKSLKDKFKSKLDIFMVDNKNPSLNVHYLHGKYDGFYSFNVNADFRVIFRYISADLVEIVTIGTHSELYK